MFWFLDSACTYGAGRSSEAMLLLLWWGLVLISIKVDEDEDE